MNTCYVLFFGNSTRYAYMYPDHIFLEKGDRVVVHTPSGEYKVCKVAEVEQGVSKNAKKRIVSKVDTKEYQDWVRKQEKIASLEKEIQERVNIVKAYLEVEDLAKRDNILKDLLKQFKSLVKNG